MIPTECFFYLVSRTTLVATAALRQALAATGASQIRPSYLGVLLILWQEDGLQAAALGRRAGLEPSSMTGILDRMERDNLIQRLADPDDRRAQRIFLTDSGRAYEAPVGCAVTRMLERLTGDVSARDLEVTKKTLGKLLASAQNERRSTATPQDH